MTKVPSLSTLLWGFIVIVCCGNMLPGVGIQNIRSQRLPPPPKPQSRTATLPLHLSLLPHQQSGYIILPKANFILPKNSGAQLPRSQNRKPDRKPLHGPPGKQRPPNNRQRNHPVNKANPSLGDINYQVSASQQIHQLLPNGPFPPRPGINFPFHEATIPQNIKLDQNGPNRPPVLPNFPQQPPILPNIKADELILNNQPPRKGPKNKNRPKPGPLPLPVHDIIEHSSDFKLGSPLLSQIEHGETLDLAHLLGAPPQENEVLEASHGDENHAQHISEDIKIQGSEQHEEHKVSNNNHFIDDLVENKKPSAESLKQHESEKSFHIPFPDFAEPEPGPQLQPSNFNPSNINSNLNLNSNVQKEWKQAPSTNKLNISGSSDTFDQLREETAPVSIYGQVLPPNDAIYSSEINNFPGLHDGLDDDKWPQSMPEMPKIIHLDVKCEKNLMRVSIDFDKPFHGIIYSKGHFSYGRCVHLPAGSGHNTVQFDISINSCGMQGNSPSGHYGPSETGSYFENTVVVQYDPLVQEVWDQARKLRCNWHDQYEKTVTFRPFNVDMLQVVRADFAGDNVGCWMQIQVGKGPWANEVAGIVRIGQTMTLVLAIKDDESKFDMMVRNCIAHDGNRAPIELVDTAGCITRPKLMSRFTKVKNFGLSASVLSFAHFQAFKFPDSTEVHIQCTVQICRHQCEDQCSVHRRRREAEGTGEIREIGLNSVLQVVTTDDLTFAPYNNESDTKIITEKSKVCMSASGFAASLILLLSIVIISCLIAAFLFLKQRNNSKLPPLPYDMAVFKKHMEDKARKQQLQQHKQLSRQQKKV